MGWNVLRCEAAQPVSGGRLARLALFVHGFAGRPSDPASVAATTQYGGEVVVGLSDETACGTQFHPEKSQHTGLQLIDNFLKWKP